MNTLKRIIAGSVATSSLAAVAFVGGPSESVSAVEPPSRDPSTSHLVDLYERYDMFRGVANESLPTMAADGLALGVVTVLAETATPGELRDGYVDYGLLDSSARLIASSDGPEMDRFGIVIDEGGEGLHSFAVDLPAGSVIEHTGGGTIEVVIPDGRTTTLAPAIAVDATGAKLPASYTLTGDEMIVSVDLDGATFPVLVDPVSANRWWGHEDWYSINDVRRYADWWNVGWIVKKFCSNWLCKVTAGKYMDWVYNTWQYAKNTGQCLHMKQLWTGQVIGINAYRCSWY